jgi:hypothetical protein
LLCSYFHPSNTGDWSGRLAQILLSLTEALTSRVTEGTSPLSAAMFLFSRSYKSWSCFPGDHVLIFTFFVAEKDPACLVDPAWRITEADVAALVELLLPLCVRGLFSKSQRLNLGAQQATRLLCCTLAFTRFCCYDLSVFASL